MYSIRSSYAVSHLQMHHQPSGRPKRQWDTEMSSTLHASCYRVYFSLAWKNATYPYSSGSILGHCPRLAFSYVLVHLSRARLCDSRLNTSPKCCFCFLLLTPCVSWLTRWQERGSNLDRGCQWFCLKIPLWIHRDYTGALTPCSRGEVVAIAQFRGEIQKYALILITWRTILPQLPCDSGIVQYR